MKKIYFHLVYNRKKKLNSRGTALLQIEAYLERKKIYFSSHIYLAPEQWDSKKELIIKHPHAESLNYMLREFILNLEKKEIELWKSGQEITLDILRDKFHLKEKSSFLNFIEKEIISSQGKSSTKRNKLSTYILLSQFNIHVDFKDIDSRFVFEFESFLHNKGYQTNTIAKHMKHLRSFVNSAINKNYIMPTNYAFNRYRIKTCSGKHSFLFPEELIQLENLTLTGQDSHLQHTLDAFLFCCYTGLRFSDFKNLTEDNIIIIDKKPWIVLHTIKTGTKVELPITLLFEGKPWRILNKYRHHRNEFFHIGSNSKTNKQLNRIGKLAQIDKHFSFHSARHTNATLLIYQGVNITTVQKLLGHQNVQTTQIYSEVMNRTIEKDLIRKKETTSKS